MPPVPSTASSFIPKRSAGNKPRTVRRYNFFLLSIISYAVFIAAPLASAALFIYNIRTESQFKASVTNLEAQIKTFNDQDLSRVVAFDERLALSQQLVNSHVSLVTLLSILENNTAETVQFKDLSITRKNAHTLVVDAQLVTGALDGALFQRTTYNTASAVIQKADLNGVTLMTAPAANNSKTATPATVKEEEGAVTLKAEFTFDADKILYAPLGVPTNGAVSQPSNLSTPNSTSSNETTP